MVVAGCHLSFSGRFFRTRPLVVALASLASVWASSAYAGCDAPVGELVSVEGSVSVQASGASSWSDATLQWDLCEGDTIRVGGSSRAAVALITDAVLRIDENTTLRLVDIVPDPEERSFVDMVTGALQSFSRQPRRLTVNTPYINGSIEGTEFYISAADGQGEITVFEGKVVAANDQGQLALAPGESATAAAGSAPQRRTLVNPREQVQWALYYPPVLALDTLDNGALQAARQCAAAGDVSCALAELEQVPESARSADYHLMHASLALSVGRVDEARGAADAALQADSSAAASHALSAIIAVVQNDNDKALAAAERAVQLDGTSAAARIAHSYALQAGFRIDDARATIKQAVKDNPEDALAWARLGELELMAGRRAQALEAAGRAAALAPDLGRAQQVYGFAALAALDYPAARAAFDKAIQLDSADPMAHFGLGLTLIGTGDLETGRASFEAAVALDGNSGLMRSYLGKAYYEERRGPLDEQQFTIAQELDAQDPTPWFYQAIALQTTNRPVAALHSLQTAIGLNDNRAVYRSRQLLDNDLASRSASVGRVYSDLGFQELAFREGFKSVAADPTSFSAHRLLTDSLAALPRHEIARVSELLVAQLLDPLSTTPIQPRLAESNLPLISTGGPESLSYNEFNPVFNRDGYSLQVSGSMAENSTGAGEVVLAGIQGNFAYSLGGSLYETDGVRDNTDQDDDLANVFLQYRLSPAASIQAEYRYRDREYGDLPQRFFRENYFPGQRNTAEFQTFRLGGKYEFSPGSVLLASAFYQESDYELVDDELAPGVIHFEIDASDSEAKGGELQHIYNGSWFNLTSGLGYFDVEQEIVTLQVFGPPLIPGPPVSPPTLEFEDVTPNELEHWNGYIYSDWKLVPALTITLGVSYDDITGEFVGDETDEFNPKAGIVWEPLPGTTIRAAYFEALRRTLATNQTLEPTQVAGFNQFYDDYDLTEGERAGIGLDQEFGDSLFVGVEYSERDLKVPYLGFGPSGPFNDEADWEESLARAYLFWTASDNWSLSAEYFYEEIDRDEFPDGVFESETHKVPLSVNYFHPSGVSAKVTTTYVDQEGVFGNARMREGADDFWLVDASISYRLPRRFGFVSIGAVNLLDKDFNYFDIDLNNSSIEPERVAYVSFTFAID